MRISDVINDYGKRHSPYLGNLVNHLPMAQLALYKMTNDVGAVSVFTKSYNSRAKINPVKEEYSKVETLEECLGNRELYEPCLDIIKLEIQKKGIEEVVTDILNKYPLGISSGLFHTIIRVAYAVEGIELDEKLSNEMERALAYYITAYREAGLLNRHIPGEDIIEETKAIIKNNHISKLLETKKTLGQKIKALYEDELFMKEGFIISGDIDKKVKSLLNLLLPAYNTSKSIVILHCITGLHAVLVLQDYYRDFPKILDILTTCILTHLLTVEELDIKDLENESMDRDAVDMTWKEILTEASRSTDVHDFKFAYTCSELDNWYENDILKKSTLIRIR